MGELRLDGSRAEASMGTERSVEEISGEFSGEWVLMEITKYENGGSWSGVALAHLANRDEVYRLEREYRDQRPGVMLFSFFAGPIVPEGSSLALSAARLP